MCEHHKRLETEQTAELPADQLPEQLPEKQLSSPSYRRQFAEVLIRQVQTLSEDIAHMKPMLSENDLRDIRAELEKTIAIIGKKEETVSAPERRGGRKMPEAEAAATKNATLAAFEQNSRNVRATAEALGVSLPTVYNRLRQYGVELKGRSRKG